MNKEKEEKLDEIIRESFAIRDALNAVLGSESKERDGLNPYLVVFAVAGFVADVFDSYNPLFNNKLEEIFYSTVKDEMKIIKEKREEKNGNQTDHRKD